MTDNIKVWKDDEGEWTVAAEGKGYVLSMAIEAAIKELEELKELIVK